MLGGHHKVGCNSLMYEVCFIEEVDLWGEGV